MPKVREEKNGKPTQEIEKTAQRSCDGCESWDGFTCFNSASQFFAWCVDCGCAHYKPETA